MQFAIANFFHPHFKGDVLNVDKDMEFYGKTLQQI
jgi:hypothetical protein